MLYMAASSLLIREKATSENHFVTPPPNKINHDPNHWYTGFTARYVSTFEK